MSYLFTRCICLYRGVHLFACLEPRSRREMPTAPYTMNDMKRLIFIEVEKTEEMKSRLKDHLETYMGVDYNHEDPAGKPSNFGEKLTKLRSKNYSVKSCRL